MQFKKEKAATIWPWSGSPKFRSSNVVFHEGSSFVPGCLPSMVVLHQSGLRSHTYTHIHTNTHANANTLKHTNIHKKLFGASLDLKFCGVPETF